TGFPKIASAIVFLSSLLLAAGGENRLIEASGKGDIATVRSLLANPSLVKAAAPDGTTALHAAARHEPAPIRDLLRHARTRSAAPQSAHYYDTSPLSPACSSCTAAIIERLLKAGVNPNATSEEGQTALLTAALSGKVDALKLLLSHGAQINVAEPVRSQTPL